MEASTESRPGSGDSATLLRRRRLEFKSEFEIELEIEVGGGRIEAESAIETRAPAAETWAGESTRESLPASGGE